jgi:hypothetical protein
VALLAMLAAMSAQAQSTDDTPLVALRFQQRSRLEAIDNSPRANVASSDQALELQTSMFVDVGRGKVRFSGELMDARTELNDSQSLLSTSLVDTLEPLQANLTWNFSDMLEPGHTGSLKVGRFTMDVGRRRLVARSGTRNTISSFTGVDWQWRGADGRNAQVFAVVPMRILPTDRASLLANEDELDRGNRNTTFRGAFYQFPALKGSDRFEVYWAGIDQGNRPQNDSLPRDFDSVGFRVFRPTTAGKWSYEVEAVLQHGKSSATAAGVTRRGLDHDAEFYHAEFGYAFSSKLSPVLLMQYDRASGDRDPFDGRNEGYDTLFGERRFDFTPQGIYGLFARGNLRTPGLRLTFVPWQRWQTTFSYRKYELDSMRDAWSGVGLRDLTGQAGRSIGRQLEGIFTWTAIPKRLTFETAFAKLKAGRFFRETAGAGFRGDPTFVYFMTTTNFGGRDR